MEFPFIYKTAKLVIMIPLLCSLPLKDAKKRNGTPKDISERKKTPQSMFPRIREGYGHYQCQNKDRSLLSDISHPAPAGQR